MTLMIAIVLSLLVGVTLGLLGGGGSILALPIFVYALGMEQRAAIASSLFVVAVTATAAALQQARQGHVVWRVVVPVAVAGMVGAFVVGNLAHFIPDAVLMAMFISIMIIASVAMWRGKRAAAASQASVIKLLVVGTVVGMVAGMVGAGGGFLIVPALTMLGGLSMATAVGSSLVVIALNSVAGFAGHLGHTTIDVRLVAIVTTTAVVGSIVGIQLGKRLPQQHLRKGFAVFVFAVAVFMVIKQL